MDYASLPHFCKREGSGSSRHSRNGMIDNCFSLDHPFHQELYNYVKMQAAPTRPLIQQGSFHVAFPEPDPDDAKIAKTIESEFHRLEDQKDCNGLVRSMSKQLSDLDIKINWLYMENNTFVAVSKTPMLRTTNHFTADLSPWSAYFHLRLCITDALQYLNASVLK